MTPQQIHLVRSSFEQVRPIANQAAALFYDKLFERDPSLNAMFHVDMARQGERLMHMLDGAVRLLDRPETLAPVLSALGQRHAGYGVRDSHYPTVGAALLDTLAAGLGEAFTAEVREAWAALYGEVSRAMRSGAALARPTPAEAAGVAID
jgi:hemoglobin-like flavoprotein